MWIGRGMLDAPHQHFTASVKIALAGRFRIWTKQTDWIETDAVMTAPSTEVQLDARTAKLANLFIDPESEAYARIAARFEEARPEGLRVLAPDLAAELRGELRAVHDAGLPFVRAWDRVIETLAAGVDRRRDRDPRIKKAADILKRHLVSPPRTSELAKMVGLSEGRLTHLFTQEMGLSLRQYVSWLRVRHVVLVMATQGTLTRAAHEAGFADSPHLSRTFRSMFGDPPSILVQRRGGMRLNFDLATALERPGPHAETDAPHIERLRRTRHSISA